MRDGRRVVILEEGEVRRMLRRIPCPNPAERAERIEALQQIRDARLAGLNPIFGARAVADRLEIIEGFVDGFALGGAIDLVRQHMSVNVALSLAFDVVRALSRLHQIRKRGFIIHGHLDLNCVLISSRGDTLVTGLDGQQGDPKRDVEGVMVVVRELLASRAGSPQGRALLDRLSQLQFSAASQLEGAIRLYLDRQDPKELAAKRARFVEGVLGELAGEFNRPEDRTPVMDEGEDSTVFEPVPEHLLRGDTTETRPESSSNAAEMWADQSEPWPGGGTGGGSTSDSWKMAQPAWGNQIEKWPDGQLDPWRIQSNAGPGGEDPTTLDGEAIEIDVVEDMAENESTDSGVVRAELMTKAAPPVDRPKKTHVMVGDYRVVASIGRGGMGEIYLARRVDQGGELVALKVLGLQESGDDAALDMFMDEAAILAQIDHPNVLKIVDFGRAHGRYFLASEYLEGRPLVRVMIEAYGRETGLDFPTVAAIGADAAYGLYAAHTSRAADGRPLEIVHRDVSPQNIFLTYQGTAKVIDFGVARASERMSRTAVGLVKGKAAYMSPEQAEGRDVDARSDVFSLGVCLWEMAAGKRLFKRDNDYDTLLAVQLADIDPPSKVRGMSDPAFDKIILQSLERDREKRTASARQFASQLVDYAASKGVKERAGRMIDLMVRLFGEAAKKELELIRSIEARSATEEEAARLRELSGVTGHGKKSGLEALDHFGKEEEAQPQQPQQQAPPRPPAPSPLPPPSQSGPISSPAMVLASVERLKAEREGKPSSRPGVPLDEPARRMPETISTLTNDTLEQSSSAGIPILDGDFESERSSTAPSAVIPGLSDEVDRVPTTLLADRRKRTRRALLAISLVVIGGGIASGYYMIEPKKKEEKPALVGGRVDSVGTTTLTMSPAPQPEQSPLPARSASPAKTSTVSFAVMLDDLRENGIAVRASEGTHLVRDGEGGAVILDRRAHITRLEAEHARGFIMESDAKLQTAVIWVGSIDGREWAARPLSVNDCPTEVRIHPSGIGLQYGGTEILLPHGGGKLHDVTLTPPALADRVEVEPLGVSLGREDAEHPGLHCKIGWWGKRVVLRRLPLGKYTLKWFGEGVSQTATLDVGVDHVTGGELVRTSSASP